ncbi:hypothetical protein WR25_04671 [Diploscapter pachys]|uniref:Uncharacterized protein n=1 Tax=Diploscapter pachys TaxID=2018661 RepID=A0A2A2M5S5_9BILA|nr:hypothetical protein WR25_04671 [Diploscapter pachys]
MPGRAIPASWRTSFTSPCWSAMAMKSSLSTSTCRPPAHWPTWRDSWNSYAVAAKRRPSLNCVGCWAKPWRDWVKPRLRAARCRS